MIRKIDDFFLLSTLSHKQVDSRHLHKVAWAHISKHQIPLTSWFFIICNYLVFLSLTGSVLNTNSVPSHQSQVCVWMVRVHALHMCVHFWGVMGKTTWVCSFCKCLCMCVVTWYQLMYLGKYSVALKGKRYKMFIRNMLFPVYSATKGLVIVYLIFSQCKHKKAWHWWA